MTVFQICNLRTGDQRANGAQDGLQYTPKTHKVL